MTSFLHQLKSGGVDEEVNAHAVFIKVMTQVFFKNLPLRTGKTVQWLKELVALPVDPGSVPYIHCR